MAELVRHISRLVFVCLNNAWLLFSKRFGYYLILHDNSVCAVANSIQRKESVNNRGRGIYRRRKSFFGVPRRSQSRKPLVESKELNVPPRRSFLKSIKVEESKKYTKKELSEVNMSI